MGGPQLGELEAGAALIGASLSVVTDGVGSVLAALIALLMARSLQDYDSAWVREKLVMTNSSCLDITLSL